MCYVLSCCLEGFGTWTFWYRQHIIILILFIPVDVPRSFLQFGRFRNLNILILTTYHYSDSSPLVSMCYVLSCSFEGFGTWTFWYRQHIILTAVYSCWCTSFFPAVWKVSELERSDIDSILLFWYCLFLLMCLVLSCSLEGFGTWTFWYRQHIIIFIEVYSCCCVSLFSTIFLTLLNRIDAMMADDDCEVAICTSASAYALPEEKKWCILGDCFWKSFWCCLIWKCLPKFSRWARNLAKTWEGLTSISGQVRPVPKQTGSSRGQEERFRRNPFFLRMATLVS